jgi:hypothetical protein
VSGSESRADGTVPARIARSDAHCCSAISKQAAIGAEYVPPGIKPEALEHADGAQPVHGRNGLGCVLRLHEATEIDRKRGRYVNDNLADYLVPVNADIGQLEVTLVSENDDKVNPAGVKGIGEVANVGTAAAVANAVYHATGIRVRELPIRLEKL